MVIKNSDTFSKKNENDNLKKGNISAKKLLNYSSGCSSADILTHTKI